MSREIFAFFMYSRASSPIRALGSSSITCFGSSQRRLGFCRRARIAFHPVRFSWGNEAGWPTSPTRVSFALVALATSPFLSNSTLLVPSVHTLNCEVKHSHCIRHEDSLRIILSSKWGIVEMRWVAPDQISVCIPSRLPSGKDK